jgi:hypothetical protein
MILACTCENSYQDKLYGRGQRVMNQMKHEANQPINYRCTVCLKIRAATSGQIATPVVSNVKVK